MSGIETPDDYSYRWYIRPLLFFLRHRTGNLSEAVGFWGRVPLAFIGFLWTLMALERQHSHLDSTLRALIRTRISQMDLCQFCIGLNGSKALERGVTEEKLLDLPNFADSPLYNEAERVALRFAQTITTTGQSVEADLMANLKRHYSDDTIVELAALIAHQNLSTRFNRALGVSE
ncbi:MAG: carboxymuconolactone decarboxylase family protein [Magnetococcales bacterium]|nr:carboxymuconolactone decarboxylase family protein [Magnetococcales bacterium]